MKRLFRRVLWNCAIGVAHLIPEATYKSEALEYLRYRRDKPKAEPEKPKPTLHKFIDPGTGRRLGRKP